MSPGSVLLAAATIAGLAPFPKTGTVDLPEGVVRVSVADAPRHSLYISNHDHLDERPVAFPVVGATNLTIRGHGTRILLDAPCIAFLFQDCAGVTLEDVSVDWEAPACREGTIESLSPTGTCFRLHDPVLRQGRSMIRVFRGDTREMLPGAGEVCLPQDAEPRTDGSWWLPHDFSRDGAGARVGDVLAFRPFLRRFPALVVDRAKDTVFRRVVVHTAWGMALLAQKSENVAWDGGGVWPSGRRFASTNADATHFSNVKGLVRVENCRFEAMMDDAINVHSTCLAIRDVLAPTEIRCRYMHDQAVGFGVFAAGDRLRFIRGETLDCEEETTVLEVRRESPREVVLTLATPLPAGYGAGDAVENADWQCAVVFRNNSVLRNRARGALFTTPHPVLVESNRFERSTSSAILFAGDAEGWYESGACRDVVIRGNRFVDCMTAFSPHGLGRALITFNPSVRNPAARRRCYHSGIVIEGNRFETFRVPLVYAFSTEDIVWRNNTVVWNGDYLPVGEDGPFVWKDCKGVRVSGGVVREGFCRRVVTDLSGGGWTLAEEDGKPVAVSVPHSWNVQDGCDGRGVLSSERYAKNSSCMNSYERKRVVYSRALPPPKPGRRYFVRCEGASITAKVRVNGRELGEHLGAFTAFCFEATGALRPSSNVLEIVVDNFSRDDVAPPVNADFTMYGGLYRGVSLIETPSVCIDPVTDGASGVRLFPDPKTGRVRAEIRVSGAPDETREFTVPDFRLWSPETPVVYTQRFEIASGDAVTETFGFRAVEFRDDGFYLNGKRRFIRGVNYHQDREGCGWAVTCGQIAADVDEMKELGADGVRTAHYPHRDFTYAQFDEKGLVAWCEQPNVNGLRFTDAFRSNCWRQTREMVMQLFNHPSIVTWSIFNELYNKVPMAEGEPEAMMEELRDYVRSLDPSRPVSAAGSFPEKKRLNAVPEVLGFNRYPGWYGPAEMPALIDEICRVNGRKGFLMTEYGAGASVNQHGDAAAVCEPDSSWHTEDYQALVHADDYRAIVSDPRVWGSFAWCLFDYGSDRRLEGEVWGRNDKGLVTFDHKTRKDAWYLYRANWSSHPTLRLVGSRERQGTTNETLTVLGFSNAGEVELRINGKSVARQMPDAVNCVRWNDVPLSLGSNVVTLVAGPLTASGVWERVTGCNFDKTKVGEVRLEDPLAFADGRKVGSADDWVARRREILELFQREMYGRMPAPIVPVVDLVDEGETLGGYAIRRLFRMYFRPDRTGPCVNWMLLAPRHAKEPSPALMFLNYGGNHELFDDPVTPVPTSRMRDGSRAKEATRGRYADPNDRTVYPVGMMIARGFAVMTACYCDISPDRHGRILDGNYRMDDVLSLFPYDASRTDNTTALGAWAWTLMRGLDLLEREKAVDARHVTVCGSSRLGKAALLAGAFDDRFFAVVPNQTGGGGSPLLKRNYGENASSLLRNFPHWFCRAFARYADNEKSMPFDSHLLMACVAPRKLLVEGFDDPFYDTEGEFEAVRAASPVWPFLGASPLPDVPFPEPYSTAAIGRDIGYVRRTERHGLSAHDWTWIMDFAK